DSPFLILNITNKFQHFRSYICTQLKEGARAEISERIKMCLHFNLYTINRTAETPDLDCKSFKFYSDIGSKWEEQDCPTKLGTTAQWLTGKAVMSVAFSVDTPCGEEHLAQKRGDVAECKRCPANVTMEMQEHLIQVSLEKENKQKRKREMLEDMRKKKGQCHSSPQPPPPPPLPPQGEVVEEMDEKEKALLDEAIKESLKTHKMEEMKEKNEEADLARACLESVQLYEQELLMRQNGSSSRYDYDETDFDIDMNF
ncbi:hypothetical protein F8388_008282, partial [Cannabis sativa]